MMTKTDFSTQITVSFLDPMKNMKNLTCLKILGRVEVHLIIFFFNRILNAFQNA